jgi:hypothetical protein
MFLAKFKHKTVNLIRKMVLMTYHTVGRGADPLPGSGGFFYPGIRIQKEKIWIWDEHLGPHFRDLKNNFLGQKNCKYVMQIRDPGCY